MVANLATPAPAHLSSWNEIDVQKLVNEVLHAGILRDHIKEVICERGPIIIQGHVRFMPLSTARAIEFSQDRHGFFTPWKPFSRIVEGTRQYATEESARKMYSQYNDDFDVAMVSEDHQAAQSFQRLIFNLLDCHMQAIRDRSRILTTA